VFVLTPPPKFNFGSQKGESAERASEPTSEPCSERGGESGEKGMLGKESDALRRLGLIWLHTRHKVLKADLVSPPSGLGATNP